MLKRSLLAVFVLAAFLAPSPVQAQVIGPEPARRIIAFRRTVTPASRIRVVEQAGGRVTHDLRLISAVAVEFPIGRMRTAEIGLRANPEVVRIDEDYEQNWLVGTAATFRELELPPARAFLRPHGIRPLMAEEDPEQPWGVDRVKAAGAWDVTRGAGVKVAVIDTGIDFNHTELAANVKGGWNATNREAPDAYLDDNGHGTHVAGTIAAVQNSTGVVGVAPEAALYGVKVLNAWGSGTFADVIAGMQWAAEHQMDVANMSLGAARGNDSFAEAVKAVTKAGVTIVAAAGNSGRAVGFPAAYPETIAISASNVRDQLAPFSSRGPEVDLIGPGVDVKSTYMGGGYDTLSGTSMATPHVAGLAALAVAAKGVRGEEAVRAALIGAAVPIEGLTPEQQGAGMVDAARLVR